MLKIHVHTLLIRFSYLITVLFVNWAFRLWSFTYAPKYCNTQWKFHKIGCSLQIKKSRASFNRISLLFTTSISHTQIQKDFSYWKQLFIARSTWNKDKLFYLVLPRTRISPWFLFSKETIEEEKRERRNKSRKKWNDNDSVLTIF